MKYVVSYRRVQKSGIGIRWTTWRLPVDTLDEAMDLAREIWMNEIDAIHRVDVSIAKMEEKGV
jgi:hypothetical protein